MVVGIEVMNFRVCEEEERAAHVGDEGPYMWWPHLPSFKLNLSDAPLLLEFSHTYLFVGDCRASEASKLNLKCEAWPKPVPSSFGCFIVSPSPPSLIDHILTACVAL
jgi:hypothetical protein